MTVQQRRMSLRKTMRSVTSYGILILVTCLISAPAVWLLITSLKTSTEYLSYPIQILPQVPQWDNYTQVFDTIPFWKYAGQTFYLALSFSILCIITSSMAGFAFARLQAPGRNRLFSIIVALIVIPTIVTIIPQFIVFSRLRLTNTYWPWILWGLSASPFHIFLFRQFFAGIPKELEDAAEVDGCSLFRTFWQIFLPNAKPALATSFIFNFSWVWSDWFAPIIYLSDKKTTLAVKLATGYVDPQNNPLTTVTLAACVVYMLPLVVMFFLGQKYIMQGAITSGLKG
jgi:multiple sugar transport system permease protein